VPWRGDVRNIILLHTHITLSQHFTNIFSPHTPLPLDTVMNQERRTSVVFCSSKPTYIIVSSTFFTMGNQEFLRCLSLLPHGKSKTGIYDLWFCASSNIQIKLPTGCKSILHLLLCHIDTAQHVSGIVVPIIRSPFQLPLEPLVTV
jgi:hypothetical protein